MDYAHIEDGRDQAKRDRAAELERVLHIEQEYWRAVRHSWQQVAR